MFSRLRLPMIQFSKHIMEPISRKMDKSYATFNPKFQTSKIVQREREKFRNNTKDMKDHDLHRRYKSTDSMMQGNNKNLFDSTKSLFFLKNIEIGKIFDEAKQEENNRVYETPISMIMRPKSKIISVTETDIISPEEVETELYDLQNIMDPSYQEVLYQEISKIIHVKVEDFNTSGPITWHVVP